MHTIHTRVGRYTAVFTCIFLLGGCTTPAQFEDQNVGPLSKHEQYLVGTWQEVFIDEMRFLTLGADRTACTWSVVDDRYERRVDDVQFETWWLNAEDLDEDKEDWVLLNLYHSTGGLHDSDRYGISADRIYRGGQDTLVMHWEDADIPCSAEDSWNVGNRERIGTPLDGEDTGATGTPGGPGTGNTGTTGPSGTSGTTPTGPSQPG